jgi:integrase/recombinase XerD
MSISYINQVISAGKLFLLYGLNKTNTIINKFERPFRERTLPVVLSVEEISRILRNTGNIKHRAILYTIYAHGMRISEILNLEIKDIDSSCGYLNIRQGKGRKDRHIPINKECLALLRQYFIKERPKVYLFEGQDGGQYSATSIRQILKKSLIKSGIKKHVKVHTLRHTYATHLLEQGVDIRYIQILLGHANIKTTEIYTHVTNKALENISVKPLFAA